MVATVLLMLMRTAFVMMLTTVLDHMTTVVFVMVLVLSTSVDVRISLQETVIVTATSLML